MEPDMKDRYNCEISLGDEVKISESAFKRFKLRSYQGKVCDVRYNTEQLVGVDTNNGVIDLHAKSLSVVK